MSDSVWESVAAELGTALEGPLNLGRTALSGPAEQPALRWYGAGGEEETLTYAQLSAGAARFAGLLKNLGVTRGDRVLFLTRPVPESVIGVLGALLFGAVPCVLAQGRNKEYIKNVAARTSAKLLVLEPESKAHVDALRKELPDLWHVVVLQRASLRVKMGAGDFLWNDYFVPAAPTFAAIPHSPSDPAFLHYTDLGMSGAIGSQRAAFALHNAARRALDVRAGDECLFLAQPGDMNYIPFGILAPLLARATQVLVEDPIHFAAYPTLTSVRVWYSSFHALEVTLRNNASLAELLKRVRHIAVAHPLDEGFVAMTSPSYGSPLRGVWWERQFGSFVLAELPGEPPQPGSLGRPVPGIEIAVVAKDGTRCATDVPGTLAVRSGPGIPFGGFWNDPAETRKHLRGEWIATSRRVRESLQGILWPVAER